jgi:hypothetical protein
MTPTNLKQKSEKKKFKIFKADAGKIIYNWAYQCPKCRKIWKYDFDRSLWATESGGLAIECECKFGQVITSKDLDKAIHLAKWQYDNLEFAKEPEKKEKEMEWKKINGRWVLEEK